MTAQAPPPPPPLPYLGTGGGYKSLRITYVYRYLSIMHRDRGLVYVNVYMSVQANGEYYCRVMMGLLCYDSNITIVYGMRFSNHIPGTHTHTHWTVL